MSKEVVRVGAVLYTEIEAEEDTTMGELTKR